jgi:hypothetical protein
MLFVVHGLETTRKNIDYVSNTLGWWHSTVSYFVIPDCLQIRTNQGQPVRTANNRSLLSLEYFEMSANH